MVVSDCRLICTTGDAATAGEKGMIFIIVVTGGVWITGEETTGDDGIIGAAVAGVASCGRIVSIRSGDLSIGVGATSEETLSNVFGSTMPICAKSGISLAAPGRASF